MFIIFLKNRFLILKKLYLFDGYRCSIKNCPFYEVQSFRLIVSFGRFEVSKFDLRGQTLVSKAQCLRSTRFGVFLGLLALQQGVKKRGTVSPF